MPHTLIGAKFSFIMNIPNLLTIIRILLTPLFVIFMIQEEYLGALLAFTCAGITDALDGVIARWLKQKTRIGAVLDPIADKALLSSSYVVTAVTGMIPPWLSVIVISRDIMILLGVLLLFLFKGGVEIRPTILGKLTTLVQLGTIFLMLVDSQFSFFRAFFPWMFYLCAAVTISSGLQYLVVGIELFNSNE